MKKIKIFPFAAILIAAMFAAGCNTATSAKEEIASQTETVSEK